MNKQIKTVLKSSDISQNWDNTNYLISEEQLLMLIKNVVKECADIAQSIGEHGHIASQQMYEHFEVEE